jgi:hypothetical protein
MKAVRRALFQQKRTYGLLSVLLVLSDAAWLYYHSSTPSPCLLPGKKIHLLWEVLLE